MGIEETCIRFIDDVDGLRACAAIDLSTGLGLAQATRQDVGDGVATAAMHAALELFRGKVTRQLAGVVPTPPSPDDFLQEAQVTGTDHLSFMATVPGARDCLLVFVTDADVSVGLGWMALHHGCRRIGAVLLDESTYEGADESPVVAAASASDEAEDAVPSSARTSPPRREEARSGTEPRVEPVVRPGPRALFRS